MHGHGATVGFEREEDGVIVVLDGKQGIGDDGDGSTPAHWDFPFRRFAVMQNADAGDAACGEFEGDDDFGNHERVFEKETSGVAIAGVPVESGNAVSIGTREVCGVIEASGIRVMTADAAPRDAPTLLALLDDMKPSFLA